MIEALQAQIAALQQADASLKRPPSPSAADSAAASATSLSRPSFKRTKTSYDSTSSTASDSPSGLGSSSSETPITSASETPLTDQCPSHGADGSLSVSCGFCEKPGVGGCMCSDPTISVGGERAVVPLPSLPTSSGRSTAALPIKRLPTPRFKISRPVWEVAAESAAPATANASGPPIGIEDT